MFTIWGAKERAHCDGISRRDFLRVGALGCAGLTLADLLRAQTPGGTGNKSVIMICLGGGPSHVDSYDMKPNAPAEYRGDFKPIQTNVPGINLCELMPMQAKIADKLAIVRNLRMGFNEHVNQCEIITGYPGSGTVLANNVMASSRPAFGSIFSKLRTGALLDLPPYVSLANTPENPSYLGAAHRPFRPTGPELNNLGLARGMTLDRFADRKELLRSFDTIRRDIDAKGELSGMDAISARAMTMVTSTKVRDAFDISREPKSTHEKYGQGSHLPKSVPPDTDYEIPYENFGARLLLARRLVEAGVGVVTVSVGAWDHHVKIFPRLRILLPQLDQALYGLVTDLHERGLNNDVAVVVWGEFGRGPHIDFYRNTGEVPGRGHWPEANFAVLAGGGLRMGQVIGQTDNRGGRPTGVPYTPQNILATLYQHLGIDPAKTLPNHQGRPLQLLDDCKPVAELV